MGRSSGGFVEIGTWFPLEPTSVTSDPTIKAVYIYIVYIYIYYIAIMDLGTAWYAVDGHGFCGSHMESILCGSMLHLI